jgi:SAM-dependent methyltransferase
MIPPSDGLARTFLKDVPPSLMKYTCSLQNEPDYYQAGFEVSTMLNLATAKHAKKKIHEFERILDFGCGAGRLIQFIPNVAHSRVYGCDVNKILIDFVGEAFPGVSVISNDFSPPLIYPSEFFDLIYSFSVFSHLTQNDELAWLQELARVGTKDALYLVTIHGEHFINSCLPNLKSEIESNGGFYFLEVHARDGGEMDFPIGYEASLHTHKNVHDIWSQWFEILELYPGDSTSQYLWPDAPLSLVNDLSSARPMGQALVVMRKK